MTTGMKLYDAKGNSTILTPGMSTVVDAGSVEMPDTLEGDDTYGIDIDLPGDTPIPESDISVMTIPGRPVVNLIHTPYIYDDTLWYDTNYMDSNETYYERDEDTGEMTEWSAGIRTNGDKTTWNPVVSTCPVAFWDKMGETEFTKVRIFGATAYMIKQPKDDINYALSSNGGTAYGTSGGEDPANINDGNVATHYQWYVYGYDNRFTQKDFEVYVTWSTPRDMCTFSLRPYWVHCYWRRFMARHISNRLYILQQCMA